MSRSKRLQEAILEIILAEPGIDSLTVHDRVEARYADAPKGRACRLAGWLCGTDSFLAFLFSPQPSMGAVWIALEVLEESGLITCRKGPAIPERRGRCRLHFYAVM